MENFIRFRSLQLPKEGRSAQNFTFCRSLDEEAEASEGGAGLSHLRVEFEEVDSASGRGSVTVAKVMVEEDHNCEDVAECQKCEIYCDFCFSRTIDMSISPLKLSNFVKW